MSLEDMCPIFRTVVSEWSAPHAAPSPQFLVRVHRDGNDYSALRVIATDFRSNTFEATMSCQQLEDLRDDIGIGGSWSEFIDYVTTSLKDGDVKIIMEGSSKSEGVGYAKLVAQKTKGMPRFSFSIIKLVDSVSGAAMANIAFALYKDYKDVKRLLIEEQECKYQMTKVVTAEQEKNSDLQKQIDMMLYSGKHKSQKINDRGDSDSTIFMVSHESGDKRAARDPSSRKGANRVVPTHRRSKVRGAVLNDPDADS